MKARPIMLNNYFNSWFLKYLKISFKATSMKTLTNYVIFQKAASAVVKEFQKAVR
jgi:hypothetical protein